MSAPETAVREALLRALPAPAAAPFEDWDAVLDHAEIARARRPTRRALVVALALLAVAVLAVPAVGIGSRVADFFWEKGEPLDQPLGESARDMLAELRPGSEPKVIASDGSRAFYLYWDANRACLAEGPVGDKVRFGVGSCMPRDLRTFLPTPEDPIYKSVLLSGGARGQPLVSRVTGLADYAASVALVGTDGVVLVSAPVTDHVFQLHPEPTIPFDSVAAIVAYDDGGNEIYREGLRGF